MNKDYSEVKGYIYKIISPSKKIYIGQTVNINNRKIKYKNLICKTQPKLYNSLSKYGWINHSFEIIEECLCGPKKILLNEREIFWIQFYNSYIDGLNCDNGGGGRTGIPLSKEHKEKLRQANLGKKHTEESKQKISDANKGEKNKFYGKKHSDETKEKIKNKKIGQKQSIETVNKRKEKNIGRKNSEETIEKMKSAHKGKIISDETKEKMSRAQKGKPWSEARRKVQKLKKQNKI